MWVWLAIFSSGLLHISAAYRGPQWQFYLFKPLTIMLMMAVAWHSGIDSFYSWAILLGLLCSLAGDIFLMLPKDRFLHGLASFFVAHLAYSTAFWSQLSGAMIWWLPALLFAGGVIVFLLLLPSLGRLILPVAIYITVITQMAWAAGEFWLTTQSNAGLLAFSGAMVFIVSDTVLAFDRFRGPFKPSTGLIMTTYFSAQSLITASILL